MLDSQIKKTITSKILIIKLYQGLNNCLKKYPGKINALSTVSTEVCGVQGDLRK